MSINIQAKTNYSFLFSGLSSSASNALSGNWLADYASIKNGSYGKLMKAYYAKDSGDLGLCFIMILPQLPPLRRKIPRQILRRRRW